MISLVVAVVGAGFFVALVAFDVVVEIDWLKEASEFVHE